MSALRTWYPGKKFLMSGSSMMGGSTATLGLCLFVLIFCNILLGVCSFLYRFFLNELKYN